MSGHRRSTVFPIALGIVSFAMLLASCTKNVVQTNEVHVTDTIRGPALLRFISLLPDGSAVTVKKTSSVNDPSYVSAMSYTTPYYIPVIPDSGVRYFLFVGTQTSVFDSVPLPPLLPNSINTLAFFLDETQNRIVPSLGNDSAKVKQPPKGYCYIRFINGMQDYPSSGPELYMDIDTLGHSIFTTSLPYPIQYGTISPYALIPVGTHTIMVRAPFTNQMLYSNVLQCNEGSYYTARVTGQRTNSTDRFQIDVE